MEFKLMRWFDERTGFKHSSRLMEPLRLFFAALVCGMALSAAAQSSESTNAPPTTASTNVSSATAQSTQARKTRVLSLSDAIQLALQHNLDIQIARFNPLTNGYAIDAAWGFYEPVFNFTGQKAYSDRPGTILSTGQQFGQNINEQDSYVPEIKGALPTGLTYDLTGNLTRSSTMTNHPAFWLPPDWISEPGPGITLDQPLLRNSWIDINRLQIKIDKANLKISEQALRLQVMQSVTAVMTNYYSLLYARGNVDAQATALKLAQQLVAENLKRVEVGTLAPLDEKQSESQAAASLAALQQAQQALTIQENQFKSLLTDNYAEWADVTPIPSEQLMAVPQDLDLQESWRLAVTQRPELVQQKLNVEKQNVTLKYLFNQVFPLLDVSGTYGRNAFASSFGNALSDIRSGNASYYAYGASVSIPLGGNLSARANYKAGKATLKVILLQLKSLEQNILVTVDNDVGAVRSSLQQVNATRDARIYAEDALAAEQKKLENGKSTSFVVLQLISNLTTARVNEILALASYNNTVTQLALDEGNTLNANHIELKLNSGTAK
jgi:outer membrane protein TolC